ncbi:MAG: hypothetical protein R3C97_08910 [Geminicoccaceae bacterium]
MADAARLSGVDPQFAERIAQSWVFLLLMRIVPFFRVHIGQSSSTPRERTTLAPQRFKRHPATRRAFSLSIRCDASNGADEALAEDSPSGDEANRLNAPARHCSSSPKHFVEETPFRVVAAPPRRSIEAIFAPLVEKSA